MRTLFKSKLYQLEIQRWALILTLLSWSIVSTTLALQNKKETLLVGIDSMGFARVISSQNDRYIQEELKAFLKEYISKAYTFAPLTFDAQLGAAANLMSNKLWDSKKSELLKLRETIQHDPYEQTAQIESLDLVSDGQVEGIINLEVIQKLNRRHLKVKVTLSFGPNERSVQNPWGYQITEVSDVVL